MRSTANRKIVRGRVLAVVLYAVVSVVVAACGGGDSADKNGGTSTKRVDMAAELEKPATVTVWAWAPGTEEAIAMFEKAHPNIDVKLQNVGQGPPHYQKLRTVLKSGKGLPDVVHMEFQFLPSFKLTDSLLDLKPYLPENFLSSYPEWIQQQISLDGGIYGVPWDTGPLGFIYRQDLLDEAGIETPIKTWDDFAEAAVKYHEANPDSYLVNMPGGQTGQWLALFWQNGARPFSSDPENLTINLTDPQIQEVTDYWDKLYEAGAVSHDPDLVDAWYQGISKGKYAGWLSAAWGPMFLQDYTKSSKGKWRAQPLPQWDEGQNVSGNWGGSTLAVLEESKSPAAAAEVARWILSETEPVEMFSFERFLFPPQNVMLKNERWLNREYPFYGGQKVNQVFADIASTVDVNWEWSPIHEYIATQGDAIKAKSIDRGDGATAALQPWQDAVVEYAKEQGLTVAGE